MRAAAAAPVPGGAERGASAGRYVSTVAYECPAAVRRTLTGPAVRPAAVDRSGPSRPHIASPSPPPSPSRRPHSPRSRLFIAAHIRMVSIHHDSRQTTSSSYNIPRVSSLTNCHKSLISHLLILIISLKLNKFNFKVNFNDNK